MFRQFLPSNQIPGISWDRASYDTRKDKNSQNISHKVYWDISLPCSMCHIDQSVGCFFGLAWPNCGPIRQLPCRPLFLSRGMPIPTDLSDFHLANSCGNNSHVFGISWMCVSRLETCNKWHRMWKNKEFLKKPSHISIAYFENILSIPEKRFQCECLLPSRSEAVK
jgi:hypothetical protein